MDRLAVEVVSNNGDLQIVHMHIAADSRFVLESFAFAIEQFSESCEVPAHEIAADIYRLIVGKVT